MRIASRGRRALILTVASLVALVAGSTRFSASRLARDDGDKIVAADLRTARAAAQTDVRIHTRPRIEGAETPEQIPDDLALTFALRTLAQGEGETDNRRAIAYLQHTGVVPRRAGRDFTLDEQRLIEGVLQLANEFVASRREIDAATTQGSTSSDTDASRSLTERRAQLLQRTVTRLDAILPQDAAEKFRVFVKERVKRQITIIK